MGCKGTVPETAHHSRRYCDSCSPPGERKKLAATQRAKNKAYRARRARAAKKTKTKAKAKSKARKTRR